ncbi:MAG: hypothetical protein F4X83_07730 [Chloroflexi bacterium]|nr:hypothetical protein [Chloroflexota bacterium]
MNNRIYDVQRLRAWHAHIAAIADVNAPEARAIVLPREVPDGSVAVVAGSFNPATTAHLCLCDGALRQPDIGVVWLSLAVHTVDKEQVTGATLEDRLCMLEMLVESQPNVGVVLCNRGLYVEQAEALQRILVTAGQELVFVVGFDKIEQILDPRYYADREASLDRLFGIARFLVAKRGTYGAQALDDLLAQKANRPYRGRIAALTTLPAYHDPALSSTSVRTTYVQGTQGVAGGEQIPAPVQSFVAATGVYESPLALPGGETIDRYALRSRILHALLAEPESDPSDAEFQAAVALASSDSNSGRALRRLLMHNDVSWRIIFQHISA